MDSTNIRYGVERRENKIHLMKSVLHLMKSVLICQSLIIWKRIINANNQRYPNYNNCMIWLAYTTNQESIYMHHKREHRNEHTLFGDKGKKRK